MIARVIGLVAVFALLEGVASAGSMNGRAGTMPAFYDGTLFTINFKELPPDGEAATLANNKSINTIYMCDACEGALPGGESFVSVIDAIQGDGFNPLWLEIQVTFNPGFTPRQLTRDDDILDAQARGEVTLSSEGEVYRCAVVGPKP